MKKILILMIIGIAVSSCSDENECPNCLELTTKSLLYTDSEGVNLLFGNQAIYNPENFFIIDNNNRDVDVRLQEENGTIAFDLGVNATSYRIFLADTFEDELQFELAERKSEVCCGNVTFSNKTILNGQEIDNSDFIIVIAN
jgi:hypothetical protein